MEPVQVIFPPEWDESIKTRVTERGKASVAEYLREPVAADIEPQELDDETERQILDGLDSPPGPVVDDAYLAGLRQYAQDAIRRAKA